MDTKPYLFQGRGTAATLRRAVADKPLGTVFTTQDLLAEGLGSSRTALDVALKRLVDEGALARAGRGLFYVPEKHPVIGALSPRSEQLAEALARRSGGELLPAGPGAANWLGLSTQVVARPVFFTTGRSTRRKLGNRTIELRQRIPRAATADPVVAHAIEALRSIGKDEAKSDAVTRRLREIFNDEQKAAISKQLYLAPEWMRPILRKIASWP